MKSRLAGILLASIAGISLAAERPNVILLMTDDQGYGDMSCHGNPVLKTPEIDKLYAQSVRFTDFHAAPKCTPTRAQLMTGVDAMRNGATRVCQGRSLPHPDFKMMPQFFADAGYATGLFGKWHLGDSYPYQPRFRGFQEVLSFRAWGITSLADYWGNDYYDPMLELNGVDKPYTGYCTDIFFDEAMKWMQQRKKEGKPFFLYLPTNTPHVPEQVADTYSTPYKGKYKGMDIPADFYGMIANIDENIGKLEVFLKKQGLRDNTILVYLADNGTQNRNAMTLFNAGMREHKGFPYEGGHRVHLFVRWENGKLKHGTDIAELTTVQDLLPTLMDLCDLEGDRSAFTGTSLASLLKGEQEKLPERMVVSQIGYTCQLWQQAVVMKDTWRLIKEMKNKKKKITGGMALYNIAEDPGQTQNVYTEYPEIAQSMEAYYEQWHAAARPLWEKKRYITIGTDHENPLKLYSNDWQGDYCDNPQGLIAGKAKGYWDLIVDRDGTYEIELRRWPEESGKPLIDSFDETSNKGALPVAKARLQVGEFDQTLDTQPEATVVRFSTPLKAGTTTLTADLLNKQGNVICGAMYVKVTRK
ncbi:Arylsulfatase [Pontiella desulfatans]|uniref:Arylsulfatase n=1 Tax=Pontiella desulfatans TaxID=2750659 RepID=A0A6C2TXP9_PONDE|nr:arylsulfatase [Pontiella desulfatans]SPS73671.1 sulfatase S1_17 [Kiritimatiellales bacterium]VGO12430.1 Arylsulfatase [Pontiella desulfatans]